MMRNVRLAESGIALAPKLRWVSNIEDTVQSEPNGLEQRAAYSAEEPGAPAAHGTGAEGTVAIHS